MKKITCNNGLDIYLNETESNLCGFSIWFKSGSIYGPKGKDGIAHLCEHLKFASGNTGLNFESIGLKMNAFTSFEFTEITGTFMSSNSKAVLEYIVEKINAPMHTKSLKKEMGVVLSEKKEVFSDNLKRMWQARQTVLWPKSPLGRDFFGTKKSLSKITQKDINNFDSKYYRNKNSITIVFSGNLNKNLLMKSFSEVLLAKSVDIKYEKVPSLINKKVITSLVGEYSTVGFHIKIKNLKKEDFLLLNILREVLANNWSSLVTNKLRSDLAVSYWPEAQSKIFNNCGFISINVNTEAKYIDKIIKTVFPILKNIQKYLTQEILNNIKKAYSLRVLSGNYSPEDLAYWYAENIFNENKIISPEVYCNMVNSLKMIEIDEFISKKVNPEEIRIINISNYKK